MTPSVTLSRCVCMSAALVSAAKVMRCIHTKSSLVVVVVVVVVGPKVSTAMDRMTCVLPKAELSTLQRAALLLLLVISTKIGRFEGARGVIILSNFGFNIFRGFRSTGGQKFDLPIDFAGHRYNSAAATVQPVTCKVSLVRKIFV